MIMIVMDSIIHVLENVLEFLRQQIQSQYTKLAAVVIITIVIITAIFTITALTLLFNKKVVFVKNANFETMTIIAPIPTQIHNQSE